MLQFSSPKTAVYFLCNSMVDFQRFNACFLIFKFMPSFKGLYDYLKLVITSAFFHQFTSNIKLLKSFNSRSNEGAIASEEMDAKISYVFFISFLLYITVVSRTVLFWIQALLLHNSRKISQFAMIISTMNSKQKQRRYMRKILLSFFRKHVESPLKRLQQAGTFDTYICNILKRENNLPVIKYVILSRNSVS